VVKSALVIVGKVALGATAISLGLLWIWWIGGLFFDSTPRPWQEPLDWEESLLVNAPVRLFIGFFAHAIALGSIGAAMAVGDEIMVAVRKWRA
jgi:hypothetical protein